MVDLEELERYRRRDSRTFAVVLEARFDEIAAELRQLRAQMELLEDKEGRFSLGIGATRWSE